MIDMIHVSLILNAIRLAFTFTVVNVFSIYALLNRISNMACQRDVPSESLVAFPKLSLNSIGDIPCVGFGVIPIHTVVENFNYWSCIFGAVL